MKFRLKDKYFNLNLKENNIEALLVTGSLACGEYDKKSNIDFCIIIDDCTKDEFTESRNKIIEELNISSDSLNIYTLKSFKNLCLEGNRYLYGTKFFKKTLYKKSDFIDYVYDKVDDNLNIKKFVEEDMNLADEVFDNYKSKYCSSEYAVNILAQLVRNVCIYICYLIDEYDVRKYQPVKTAIAYNFINIPFSFNEYKALYNMRRNYRNNKEGYVIKGYLYGFITMWYNKYMETAKELLKRIE